MLPASISIPAKVVLKHEQTKGASIKARVPIRLVNGAKSFVVATRLNSGPCLHDQGGMMPSWYGQRRTVRSAFLVEFLSILDVHGLRWKRWGGSRVEFIAYNNNSLNLTMAGDNTHKTTHSMITLLSKEPRNRLTGTQGRRYLKSLDHKAVSAQVRPRASRNINGLSKFSATHFLTPDYLLQFGLFRVVIILAMSFAKEWLE